MARSKRSQSKHDSEVRRIARSLQDRGLEVKADVKGFKRPDTIGGFRPDVVATDGKKRMIVEVETPDSVDSCRDRKQQSAFESAAGRAKHTTFHRKIVK